MKMKKKTGVKENACLAQHRKPVQHPLVAFFLFLRFTACFLLVVSLLVGIDPCDFASIGEVGIFCISFFAQMPQLRFFRGEDTSTTWDALKYVFYDTSTKLDCEIQVSWPFVTPYNPSDCQLHLLVTQSKPLSWFQLLPFHVVLVIKEHTQQYLKGLSI